MLYLGKTLNKTSSLLLFLCYLISFYIILPGAFLHHKNILRALWRNTVYSKMSGRAGLTLIQPIKEKSQVCDKFVKSLFQFKSQIRRHFLKTLSLPCRLEFHNFLITDIRSVFFSLIFLSHISHIPKTGLPVCYLLHFSLNFPDGRSFGPPVIPARIRSSTEQLLIGFAQPQNYFM